MYIDNIDLDQRQTRNIKFRWSLGSVSVVLDLLGDCFSVFWKDGFQRLFVVVLNKERSIDRGLRQQNGTDAGRDDESSIDHTEMVMRRDKGCEMQIASSFAPNEDEDPILYGGRGP